MTFLDNLKGFLSNYGRPIIEYLSCLNDDEVSALAELLGIDCQLIKNLIDAAMQYINNQLDINKLLLIVAPIIVTIFTKLTNKKAANPNNNLDENSQKSTYSPTFDNEKGVSENHLPIDNTDILYSINAYINS